MRSLIANLIIGGVLALLWVGFILAALYSIPEA